MRTRQHLQYACSQAPPSSVWGAGCVHHNTGSAHPFPTMPLSLTWPHARDDHVCACAPATQGDTMTLLRVPKMGHGSEQYWSPTQTASLNILLGTAPYPVQRMMLALVGAVAPPSSWREVGHTMHLPSNKSSFHLPLSASPLGFFFCVETRTWNSRGPSCPQHNEKNHGHFHELFENL